MSNITYRQTLISYGHESPDISRHLAGILRDHFVPVWFDEWELPRDLPEDQVYEALKTTIARMDAMIVLETPSYRRRIAQKVPGHQLAFRIAPPDFPVNDGAFLGYETHIWIETHTSKSKLFKLVRLIFPEIDYSSDSTQELKRYSVYYRVMTSYGKQVRVPERVLWESCHEAYHPVRGTLVGEEIHFPFVDWATTLPFLLTELRA